jgi:hypothetical protein
MQIIVIKKVLYHIRDCVSANQRNTTRISNYQNKVCLPVNVVENASFYSAARSENRVTSEAFQLLLRKP